jgi:hypothetical protein
MRVAGGWRAGERDEATQLDSTRLDRAKERRKIKFIIYDYEYLPFGCRVTAFPPPQLPQELGPRAYQIQITGKKSISRRSSWPPSDRIRAPRHN